MTTYAHTPYEHNTITAANIEVAREMLPCDQATELEIGCETWGIKYDGTQRGQVTIWPNNRAAICFGADSIWGDWDAEARTITTDDGEVLDEYGEAVEA